MMLFLGFIVLTVAVFAIAKHRSRPGPPVVTLTGDPLQRLRMRPARKGEHL